MKLAINGGKKVIDVRGKHFQWPIFNTATERRLIDQLHKTISIYDRSGIIKNFEERFRKLHNKKHGLLTNSGTSALHSLYVGADLHEEDEVICPAYTFFATVTPIFFTGATPILCDIDKVGNIDPKEIRNKITKKTKAIMVTHMWGVPANIDEIKQIAEEQNLLLFEDCSHAYGATYKGKKVGTFGDGAVWSLNVEKIVQGGEGGILLTDRDEIYYRALLLGQYNKRCRQEIPETYPLYKYAVTGMGLKLRSHPLAIPIADQQLENIDKILKGKRFFAKKLANGLSNLPGIELPPINEKDKNPAWYAFLIQYKPKELGGLPIDKFYKALLAEGCKELDRPGSTCPLNYHPLFQAPEGLFPRYKGKVRYKKGDFPRAEKFHEHSLKLPVWHRKQDEEIVNLYIKAFKKVVKNYKELLENA